MVSVEDFYRDDQKEWHRLDLPLRRIEFASTLKSYARKLVTARIGKGSISWGCLTTSLLHRRSNMRVKR